MTKIKKETIYQLPDFTYSNISCVYIGKPNKCMCGCSGTYYYTKINQFWSGKDRGYAVKDSDVDDEKVQRILNKVRKNSFLGIEVLDNKVFTIIIGKTQYTIYLKD